MPEVAVSAGRMISETSQRRGVGASSPSSLTIWRVMPSRAVSSFIACCGWVGPRGRPARLVHHEVEAGEDHSAVRQSGNRLQQRAGGGDRTRGTGCDEGGGRFRVLEAVRLAAEDGGAAGHRSHRLFGGEALRIGLAGDGQEVEDRLAVMGGLDAIEFGDGLCRDVLGLDRIQEFGERDGEAVGLVRRCRDLLREAEVGTLGGPVVDQVHQEKMLAGGREGCFRKVLSGGGRQEVLVDVADGADARKQDAAARRSGRRRCLRVRARRGASGGGWSSARVRACRGPCRQHGGIPSARPRRAP